MTSSSFIYCSVCGAANQAQATLCFACGHPLETAVEDTAPPSPAGPPVSRSLLARRYRIIALVGEGGFGAVYKAVDMQRNEALVALKQINLSGLRPRDVIEATETFNREVGMLSGLKHPNLPRIYNYFTDAEHWYLAMDFIEGETLEEYLNSAKGGYLPVEEVVEIGIQLCSVLEYLHTRQPPIIFRDVKPANVMRAATRLLYLIDFGIARRFRPGQRRDTTVLGSPGYAPPEQYGTAQTTAQSDIYSLGATLRCLLTGTDPSVPTSGSAPLYAQEQGVPAELDQLLGQMLELDADKRPASMEVVKQVLQQMQVERWPSQLSVPPVRQPLQPAGSARQQQPFKFGPAGQVLQPPAKRGISRRTVILGLVGVAAVGGGIAWWSAFSQAPQASQDLPTTPPPTPYVDPYRLYAYRGHTGPVFAMAWSPDSRHIASGGADGTVQVWVASTGGNVLTYGGHYDVVDAVAWSPDSRRIASASFDKTVQVWNAATGETLLTYTGHLNAVIGYLNAYAVACSPDGKRIASGGRRH